MPSSKKINPKTKHDEFSSLYNSALVLKNNKEYVKAIELYSRIIAEKPEADNTRIAKLYEDIGDIYFDLKDFDHAFNYLEKALQIYADNNLHDLQLEQYKKLAGLCQGIFQFQKAIELFEQGLSLSTRVGKLDQIIDFELSLGNVLNWADRLEESEKFLVSAIEKEKHILLPAVKLRAHLSYAILLRKMKKFEEAEKYFKKAMKFSTENNDVYLMDITKSYGILQFEMKNYDAAEPLLLDAEQKAMVEGNDAIRAVIFEYLSHLYEYRKDYEKAHHYLKKWYERKLELLERGYSEENNKLHAKIGLADAKRERANAEEMANAKSLFIATISHEIRTPMNIILGTTSLLLNDAPKDGHIKYLHTLKRSGENLLGIINDILDVSKIEAGRLEIEYEPVLLDEVFLNIVNGLDQQAKKKICS